VGASRRGLQDPEPQVPHRLITLWGAVAVAVMDEDAVAVVNSDGCTPRLKGPSRGGMRGHTDVEDVAARVFHDHQDVEEPKGRCDHHAAITGDHRQGTVAHNGTPALRGDASTPSMVQARGPILPHGPR
jgi:hypothetical protein